MYGVDDNNCAVYSSLIAVSAGCNIKDNIPCKNVKL